MGLHVNLSHAGIDENILMELKPKIEASRKHLYQGSGKGNDFLGWIDWSEKMDLNVMTTIKQTGEWIRNNCDVFLVIGIGGSYLGSIAAIQALKGSFYNATRKESPEIYFLGNNLSTQYYQEVMSLIQDKSICVNVISKSGTTTEPAVAFRMIKKMMEEKYGPNESAKRIFATTDQTTGALLTLAKKEGYPTFVIEDNIGGRYSVITPVGLLPMMVAGINIDEFMQGVHQGYVTFRDEPYLDNASSLYAAYRYYQYTMGKKIEILVQYEPALSYLSEWWKQLYGESEGKEGKGLFPASVNFTADLHSMGQYIQEGERTLIETVLKIKNTDLKMTVPEDPANLDGLNYLSNKELSWINDMALEGTLQAHVFGNVPNCIIEVDRLDSYHLGLLMYFFMVACGISGYLLDVNPFDQPGVEAYKKNMFALLGKP